MPLDLTITCFQERRYNPKGFLDISKDVERAIDYIFCFYFFVLVRIR